MLKRLLLTFSLIGLTGQALASNTVIENPDSVAPFHLCFTNDGPQEFPSATDSPLSLLKPSQTLPFCLSQDLSIDAYKQLSIFEKDVFAAVAMWQSYFNSEHPVNINIIINLHAPRCEGGSFPGKTLSKPLTLSDGDQTTIDIVYPSALTSLLGQNVQGTPDIKISFHPAEQNGLAAIPLCYDMTPTKSNKHCVAGGHRGRDITTTMLHELGHGYGIRSLRKRTEQGRRHHYGDFINNQISAYDYQTNNENDYHDLFNDYQAYYANHAHPLLFTGNSTVQYRESNGLSGPLPLCNQVTGEDDFSQNFAHFCFTSCFRQ